MPAPTPPPIFTATDHKTQTIGALVVHLNSPGSNGDGVLDAHDPAFAAIRVWVDINNDGHVVTKHIYSYETAAAVIGDLGGTADQALHRHDVGAVDGELMGHAKRACHHAGRYKRVTWCCTTSGVATNRPEVKRAVALVEYTFITSVFIAAPVQWKFL